MGMCMTRGGRGLRGRRSIRRGMAGILDAGRLYIAGMGVMGMAVIRAEVGGSVFGGDGRGD
jgi:hypothetical protein